MALLTKRRLHTLLFVCVVNQSPCTNATEDFVERGKPRGERGRGQGQGRGREEKGEEAQLANYVARALGRHWTLSSREMDKAVMFVCALSHTVHPGLSR